MAAVQRVPVYTSYVTELHHKITVAGETDGTGSSQFFFPQLKYIRSVNVSERRGTTQVCKKKKIIFTEQRVRLRDVRVSVDDVAPRKALITLGSEGIAVYA